MKIGAKSSLKIVIIRHDEIYFSRVHFIQLIILDTKLF